MTEKRPFFTKWAIVGVVLGAVFMAVAQVIRGIDYHGIGPGTSVGGCWGMLIMKTVETNRQMMHKVVIGAIVGAIVGAVVGPIFWEANLGAINKAIAMMVTGTLYGAMIGTNLRWATIGAVVGFVAGVIIMMMEREGGVWEALATVVVGTATGANLGAFLRTGISQITTSFRSISMERD